MRVFAPGGVGEEVVGAGVAGREVAVGLVEDEGGAVGAGDLRELGDELGGVFGAGGVVGGDQHDGAGARGQAGAGGGRVGEHAGAAGERDRLDAGHVEPHLVVEVPGHRQQDGVAGGGEGHRRGAEGLVAAGGDGDLLGADLAAVEGGGAPGDLGAQGGEAEDRAVEVGVGLGDDLGHVGAQGFRGRVDGGGLAEVEERAAVGEVDALEPAAGLHHRRRGGGADERAQGCHRASEKWRVRSQAIRRGGGAASPVPWCWNFPSGEGMMRPLSGAARWREVFAGPGRAARRRCEIGLC